ncbi:MAG: sigma-70 family RNA polymerase sigma factor [Actinomycetota bacterium]
MKNDLLADLARQAKKNDREAFGRIYDQCVDSVYRFVFYRVGRKQDAEDITEDVFINAFQAIGRYEEREDIPFSAWLFRIAQNRVNDHYRRQARSRTVNIEDELLDGLNASREPDPAVAADARQEVWGALGELTDEQQNVIILRFFVGLKISEIAGFFGRSETSVKALQHRALKSLKRLLEKE